MSKSLSLYFSFRSPYSFLAIGRVRKIIAEYNLDGTLKIVRPLALREPDFFKSTRPQFVPYLLRDVVREAQILGLPMGLPKPDPVTMNMETGMVDEDQPLMDMIIGLGLAACALGDGFAYAEALTRTIWQGTENWHEEAHLINAAKEVGLDHGQLEAWAKENTASISSLISVNEEEQLRHHWGVPLMLLDGEPFFGQDRVDALVWRLEQS